MFIKKNYEKLSESLQTSEEFLFAIEKVSGSKFNKNDERLLSCSNAKQLWRDGGNEKEILSALPIDNAEEGEQIFWAHLTAEFSGTEWFMPKEVITRLKKITGHRSDRALAEFLGVTKSTIALAKSGTKTKLHSVLPMLLHLISVLHEAELKTFLEKFKKST